MASSRTPALFPRRSKSPWTARTSSRRSRGVLVLTLPGSCLITENQQMLVRLVWFSPKHGLLSEWSVFSAAALGRHPEPSDALLRSQPATQPIWLRPHTLHVGGTDVSRTGPMHDMQTMQSHVSLGLPVKDPSGGSWRSALCGHCLTSCSYSLYKRQTRSWLWASRGAESRILQGAVVLKGRPEVASCKDRLGSQIVGVFPGLSTQPPPSLCPPAIFILERV